MDISSVGTNNFVLHNLTGGQNVIDQKKKEKDKVEQEKLRLEKEAIEQRVKILQSVNKSEPGSMIDVFA